MPSVNRDAINASSPDDTSCVGPAELPKSNASVSVSSAQGNEVTPWSQDPSQPVQAPQPQEVGPTCSPQELQRAMQMQSRENAIDALTDALPKLREAVAAESGNFGTYNTSLLDFASAAQKDPSFRKMLKTFSRDEISEALGRLVRDVAPDASDRDVKAIRGRLVSELDQHVVVASAAELRRAVVEKLETAASNFDKTANDPKQLAQLVDTLRRLESPSASGEQRAQASMLRGALGLPAQSSIDAGALRSALGAQARLIHHEGERINSAGETTLYRALLVHSEVSGLSDAAPGSWAAGGPRAVLARGHSDEQAIANAKLASAVMLGIASGGMGLGVGLSAGMAGAFNAPGVINAWKEIDHARAGVAAGTADGNAVVAAERKAWIETAEAGVAVVAAGGLAAHAAHGGHAATGLADATLKHAMTDGVFELVLGLSARGIHHAVEPDALASKGGAMKQLRAASSR
jgi:hypothetical protein